ncbi:NEL-type E3 ubiquitin ligase domain-containing protein [Pseudomonas sp. PB3P13]
MQAWRAQNRTDRAFGKLQDVYAFAAPLLSAKLKEQYGIEDDVQSTYLRLYFPKNTPWYAANILPGHASRTVSLVDAALHNFAQGETFTADSQFISKPDANGHFDIKRIKAKMSIEQFKQLCRDLDIGGQYNNYLRTWLLPRDEVAKALLEYKSTTSEKAVLNAAAHLALLKKDISDDAFNVVQGMIDGRAAVTLDGKVMQCAELSMMDASLTGIVLFIAAPTHSRGTDRLIAYVPHDPEHPLKEYASALAFVQALTRQLRENKAIPSSGASYWQFFSQFLDQQQRGHFFADLDRRLSVIQWHEKDPLDPGPSWRATPVDKPNLEFRVWPITRDLWQHLYQMKVSKIINDAREIAVSTAQADSQARWAWWDNFKKMLSDIFNAALLVLTPFVPGLGELMLAYTAYQLTTEVVEGVVDLAEGQWAELAEHVVGVVTDVIQLAAFGAGAAIGAEFQLKLSPFVEGLKPVQLPDGKSVLWNPDLAPYQQQDLRLPDASQPDALGLHQHQGKTILPLEGQHFEVRHDQAIGQHRIQHPTRPQAYAPTLRHNGEGAWVHEGESPHNWEGSTLMRRIGHSVDRYSTTQLENIRRISGTEEASLRRMHVENAAPPPLLADTLSRLKIHEDTEGIGERIRSGQPLDPGAYWFDRLVPDMPGWPADKALKVYENTDLKGPSHTYGNPDAADAQTLRIGRPDMMAGELPQRLADFLSDDELSALLGRSYPKNQQVQVLRNRIADAAEDRKADIFNYRYGLQSHSSDTSAQLLQRQFPELPARVAQTLVDKATPVERSVMTEKNHLPLRVKNQARESAFELRAARAWEGFHEPRLMGPDTEQLTLNALKLHTDTYENLRIEVRDGTHDGPLRGSAGSPDASDVRVLVRDEHGRYEVWDGRHIKRHEAGEFYQALLRALPENKRQRLGYRTTQGEHFKQWVMVMTEPPAERRTLLAQPPIRPVVPRETDLLLRGGALTKGARTVEEKVQNLYPHFDEAQVDAFSRSLHAQGDPHLAVERLQQELASLQQKLEQWRQQYLASFASEDPSGNLPAAYLDFSRNGGQLIVDRLLECFERKSEVFNERSHSLEGGYTLDLSAEFRPHDLERWWRELPDLKPYLDQVTTLNLDGSRFSAGRSKLLSDFRHIRRFSARHCELTALPEGVAQMRLLETLRLSDNQIRLSPAAVEQLRNFTRMETLRLDNNPLGTVPDIGRMPRLKVLNLYNTGVETWPAGLFSKPRPRGFFLDLQANPISAIPQVAPGSEKAFLIARTRVIAANLSERNRITYEGYRESLGMTPVLQYPPSTQSSAESLITRWPVPDDTYRFDSSPGVGAYRAEAWYDLIGEPGSEGFFTLLAKLTQSADYLQGGPARQQLSDRVWRMVDAANLDTKLREELFLMSLRPDGCEDAGAQLFNNMGVKVLVSEAELFSTSAAERERKLVTLAKGAARLEQVNEIARKDIKARKTRPDEVEVHLAYETGLAKRLDLPWQSEAMRFGGVAGVTEEHIDIAYNKIIEQEAGDGLIDQMNKQKFWEDYLYNKRPGEFEANTRRHQEKIDVLTDLDTAQRELADAQDLSPPETDRRRQNLIRLATRLGIDKEEVLTGKAMTTDTYGRVSDEIGVQKLELARRLTREALARAELDA